MVKRNLLLMMLPFILFAAMATRAQSDSLFFVFLNTNPERPQISKEQIAELQDAHLKNIGRLAGEGIIKAAGPFDGGGGLFILSAGSMHETTEILQSDPAIKANRFRIEVFPLTLVHNGLCESNDTSGMVTYQFVRTFADTVYPVSSDDLSIKNRAFLANSENGDHVIVQGIFNPGFDGFIVIDVADTIAAKQIVEQHPAIREGLLKYDIKSLWIAEKTFCKN